MQKWEYATGDYATDEITNGLTLMGNEGWQAWALSEITWTEGDKRLFGRRVYFKRPKQTIEGE